MPCVPMLMPSVTVMVLKYTALPPAALMPFCACSLSSPRWTLQGVMLLAEEATAIWGFLKSSSVKPTARNMERAGARSWPSTTMDECGRREWAVWHIGRGRKAER